METEVLYRAAVDLIYEKTGYGEIEEIYKNYMSMKPELRSDFAADLIRKYSVLLDACEEAGSVLYYYFLSFLIYATNRVDLFEKFVKSCSEDISLSFRTKYALYHYASNIVFLGVVSENEKILDRLDCLYRRIYLLLRDELGEEYKFIPQSERDEELVFVLTSQFLSLNHGPTKTTLDRCEVLKKSLNKKVYIINTAEMMPEQEDVPVFRMGKGLYEEKFSLMDKIEYRGEEYSFTQYPKEMPSVEWILDIAGKVKEAKPFCMITIGGDSLVSDLCSLLVPNITISTVPSKRVQTYGQFQAIGGKMTEQDLHWAEKYHLTPEHFIESQFTWSFKDQITSFSREDLALPKEGFVVALIGGRLEKEMDAELIEMLKELMRQRIYVAFIGGLREPSIMFGNDFFSEYIIDLGFQEDVLAVLECIDVCINPKRRGGGGSVVESLYKGVPVVTFNYGDGGLGAGKDFWVRDYEEMYRLILRYAEDTEFYREMSGRAKERAAVLTDSSKEFVKIIKTAMSRGGFSGTGDLDEQGRRG